MAHYYDTIIAETDSRKRALLLAKEFKTLAVPIVIGSLHKLLEKVTFVTWKSDPNFFGSNSPVEDIGDGWWMCSVCSDAFEVQPGVCKCPTCQKPIVAHGLQVVLGEASMLLVPWQDARNAIRVETRASFFGIPTNQRIKWTESFDSEEELEPDAWVLSLVKQVLHESDLSLENVDATTLFDVFPLEKDGGYYKNKELLRYLGTAPLFELEAIAELIRGRFTFLPGGNWCPDWMEGERWDGSPLLILEPIMGYIKKYSIPRYNHWAGVLLGYVLSSHDVFEHDERAMSRNMADDLIKSLEIAPEEDFTGVSLENLLSSIERSVESAACVDYGVNLFGLLLHVLSWDLSVEQRNRMVKGIICFSCIETTEEIDALGDYINTNVITIEQFSKYAAAISALPEAAPGSRLDAVVKRIKKH